MQRCPRLGGEGVNCCGSMASFSRRIRTGAGNAYVYARDHWFDQSTRHALHERCRLLLSRGLSHSDALDPEFERPLSQIQVQDLQSLFPTGLGLHRPKWRVPLDNDALPRDLALECNDRTGVWPISFSYPKSPLKINPQPVSLIADIIPGRPYSFDDPHSYLDTYQGAYLGLTHRKAGWDCFRHVEIMASGAIPLMIDGDEIPKYAMVHYPKRALADAATIARQTGAPPDEATRQAFRAWFQRHLTSEAMARYVLEVSGLNDSEKVLFVDAALPEVADYQSVLTLIGLKHLLGQQCHVMFPVDYIYSDTMMETSSLYGRGFGYSRVLPGELRSSSELGKAFDLRDFDALIVGSVARNLGLAMELLAHFVPHRTVWIHGEDGSPTMDEAHWMKSRGVNLFVRPVHVRRR